MEKTGLPHLDINSFPTVNLALKTELKVLRSLKNKSNQKRQAKLLAPELDSIWSFSHL